jgi:hypothetical protein
MLEKIMNSDGIMETIQKIKPFKKPFLNTLPVKLVLTIEYNKTMAKL